MKLKPFAKVLTRDYDNETWEIDIFGRYDKGDPAFPYHCVNERYKQCIPYEGNESLLGTTTSPKPEYEFKNGDPVIVWNNNKPNNKFIRVFNFKNKYFYGTYNNYSTLEEQWDNCIPFKTNDKE